MASVSGSLGFPATNNGYPCLLILLRSIRHLLGEKGKKSRRFSASWKQVSKSRLQGIKWGAVEPGLSRRYRGAIVLECANSSYVTKARATITIFFKNNAYASVNKDGGRQAADTCQAEHLRHECA